MDKKLKTYKKIVLIESVVICILSILSLKLFYDTENTKKWIDLTFNNIVVFIKLCILGVSGFLKQLVAEYNSLEKIFNNREWAILFLIVLAIVVMLFSKKIRKSFHGVLAAFFKDKIMLWLFRILLYSIFVIVLLSRVGYWEISLFKSSVVWFLTVGTFSTYKAYENAKDYKYYVDIIKDSFKMIVIITFVANLYTLSFVSEVIFIFFVLLIGLMIAVIDIKPEDEKVLYKSLKRVLEVLLSIMGLFYITNSIRLLLLDRLNLNVISLIKEMTLPSIMSISLILFNYIYVAYAKYEIVFIRLGFKKIIEDKYRFYLYIRIVFACKLNYSRIDTFTKVSGVMTTYIKSIKDVNKLMKEYKLIRKVSVDSFT